jgi:hypothetical protein
MQNSLSSDLKTSQSLSTIRALGTKFFIAGLLASNQVHAIEYGPFSLTGFAKIETLTGSNQCTNCQRFQGEDKQRFWADELVPGRTYGTKTNTVTLFQPYLGAKFDLGQGIKLSGLLSQRWRDGKEDIPGFYYDKNVALSHEDFGSLRIGAMTTRTWALADYPYGTNVNLAEAWGSSGAGYGLLTNAARYTSRPLNLLEGTLVVEGTYSPGNTDFKIHKPRFVELYAQYHRGPLVIDAMLQDTRNGTPAAWGHGPFTGPTPSAADDNKVGGSGQGTAMVMGRYQLNNQVELQGGIRRNRWSGAYAAITNNASPAQWNNMFNVDWNGTLNGVANPGYAATSVDTMLGLRYRTGKWTASTGFVHLGKGHTANPSDRGQNNTASINTVGLLYEYVPGVSFYASAGMVHYSKLGLSPISMPSNSAFTRVDSRIAKSGNWGGLGVVFVF